MATSTGWIDYDEGAAPATPAAGDVRIYAKTDGLLYSKDDAGTETLVSGGGGGAVATDAIWTTSGKVAVATGTATATEQWPPGHEFDYAEITSPVVVTATTEAGADTVVSGAAVVYDGSTRVKIEFFTARADPVSASVSLILYLYDGSTSLGFLGITRAYPYTAMTVSRILTPSSASHTYSVRATTGSGSAVVQAGAGGAGAMSPAYIRITKA